MRLQGLDARDQVRDGVNSHHPARTDYPSSWNARSVEYERLAPVHAGHELQQPKGVVLIRRMPRSRACRTHRMFVLASSGEPKDGRARGMESSWGLDLRSKPSAQVVVVRVDRRLRCGGRPNTLPLWRLARCLPFSGCSSDALWVECASPYWLSRPRLLFRWLRPRVPNAW